MRHVGVVVGEKQLLAVVTHPQFLVNAEPSVRFYDAQRCRGQSIRSAIHQHLSPWCAHRVKSADEVELAE